jgi:hypothetical protein
VEQGMEEMGQMKILKFKTVQEMGVEDTFRWSEDVGRIIGICYARGCIISQADAQAAWEQYSDDLCAGWLILGEDDEVFRTVLEYCEVNV